MDISLAALALLAASEMTPIQTAKFRVTPAEHETTIPELYQLSDTTLTYNLRQTVVLPHAGVRIHQLTFPSLDESDHVENNTVHALYYQPEGEGPFPAAIILDVLAGDQSLSRSMGLFFAQRKVAALFVQMAYYGPRRPPNSSMRLLSPNIEQTMNAIGQTVKDCRCAASWLAQRDEVDPDRIGIVGTSLGSFMAGLTGEMEPRISRVVLLLGGGGIVDGLYDHPRAKLFRQANELFGGSKEKLARVIAPVDPLTHANRLKSRDVLMIAASRDTIVPAKMATALWEASGKPKIIWYDTDHYGAIFYLLSALRHVVDHLAAEQDR